MALYTTYCGGQWLVDFAAVNRAALGYLPSLVRTWCPNGRRCGREYLALNPTWADFAPRQLLDKLGDRPLGRLRHRCPRRRS